MKTNWKLKQLLKGTNMSKSNRIPRRSETIYISNENLYLNHANIIPFKFFGY